MGVTEPFTFLAKKKLFKYPGVGGWHFVELSKSQSETIRAQRPKTVGWGFVRMRAKLGTTLWDTTLFPTREGSFLLSVKASVRKKEEVLEGDTITISCTLL